MSKENLQEHPGGSSVARGITYGSHVWPVYGSQTWSGGTDYGGGGANSGMTDLAFLFNSCFMSCTP